MRASVIVIALVVVAASVNATATTYQLTPVSTYSAPAPDSVVVGRVRSTAAEWHGRRILTRVVLEPDTEAPPIEFLVPGGSVGGVAMRVSGAPRFTVGERTQVTLRQTLGGLRLVGLGTGKVVLP